MENYYNSHKCNGTIKPYPSLLCSSHGFGDKSVLHIDVGGSINKFLSVAPMDDAWFEVNKRISSIIKDIDTLMPLDSMECNVKEGCQKKIFHPMARPNNNSGAFDMKAGDTVIDHDGKTCTADEFLQDGEVYVSYKDGTYATLNWNQVRLPTKEETEAIKILESLIDI